MKKFILPLLFVLLAFSSCTDYGKSVKINKHLEVYIKGENVTEAEAKKLGNYLNNLSKDSNNDKSIQLSKDSNQYVVRMVVDENVIKKDTTVNQSFGALQFLLETEVFVGSKVKLILTDNTFKDLNYIFKGIN